MATRTLTISFATEEQADAALAIYARSYGYPDAALNLAAEGEEPKPETVEQFIARVDIHEKTERIHAQAKKEAGAAVDAHLEKLFSGVTASVE